MFSLAREFVDLTFGHGCQSRVGSLSELINQNVFIGGMRALTVGAPFPRHGCTLEQHPPIAGPGSASTKVFIRGIGVVLTYKRLDCGDYLEPANTLPPPTVFAGS